MNTLTRVPPTRIKIGKRHRRDLGDLSDLIASIQSVGLIQPVILDKKHNLIAGQRRIEAWKRAKPGEEIPAVLVDSITAAAPLLMAERDENTCRKDFAPSEAVALGEELAVLEKPKAAERKSAGGAAGGKASGKLPEASVGETRDVIGAAVGMSGRTYEKAREVVAAANDPAVPAPVRAVAIEAVQEMDATGKVDGAYRKITDARITHALENEEFDDVELRRSQLRSRASRALSQVHEGLLALSADHVALVLDDATWKTWEQTEQQLIKWFAALNQARPKGLRSGPLMLPRRCQCGAPVELHRASRWSRKCVCVNRDGTRHTCTASAPDSFASTAGSGRGGESGGAAGSRTTANEPRTFRADYRARTNPPRSECPARTGPAAL